MADDITQLFNPAYKFVKDESSTRGRHIESLRNEAHYILIQTDNGFVFLLRGESYSVVDRYEVYSGFNNPFEYVVITMKLKRMESQAPELFKMDSDGNAYGDLTIHAGFSKLLLKGRACGVYIVSNIKLTDETLTLTAYTHFEELRSKILQQGLEKVSVLEAMKSALLSCGITTNDLAGNVCINGNWVSDRLRYPGDIIDVPDNSYAWRILQICAIHMGCKIFFTGTKCHIVNYSVDGNPTSDQAGTYVTVLDNIHLHKPTDSLSMQDSTNVYLSVWDCCTSRISSPSNSSDSVKTTMAVRINGGKIIVDGASTAVSQSDANTAMTLEEYSEDYAARHFCQSAVRYTINPSKCVKFTLNESMYEKINKDTEVQGFERNILDPARATVIQSDYNDSYYTNNDKDGVPQVLNLLLSSVEMDYPKCNTTYTFGENKPISLDTSLSEIRSAR